MILDLDFSKLTVGDMRLLSDPNNVGNFIAFFDKVVVGGVSHLPMNEFHSIAEQVLAEFSEWMKTPGQERSSLAEMLQDIKGL